MTAETPTARNWGRGIAVGVIIAVASLLVIVSVLSIWLNTVAFDTPTWQSTSRTLIQNPAVQKQVGTYLVDQVYNNGTVEQNIDNALPPALRVFSPQINNGMQQVTTAAAVRLLGTTPVQNLWVGAMTQAHSEVVKLIEDQATYVRTNGGRVVLDLRPLLIQVAGDAGLSAQADRLLPANAGQIDVVNSNQLSTVQTLAQILHVVADFAWLVTVALFVLAVWLARGFRRRALLWTAIGMFLATLVLVFVRRELGHEIINALVSDVSVRPALLTAWYIGTDVLGTMNITLMIIALVAIVGVWLSGAGRISTAMRNKIAPWLMDPLYAFGVPGAILLILILWGPLPVFQKLVPVLTIIVLGAVGIEALRRQTVLEHAPATPAPPAAPDPPA